MNQRESRKQNRIGILLRALLPLAAVVVALSLAMTTFAWLAAGRHIAALAELSDPTAIFINAGNREDIRHLDLGGIDLEDGQTSRDYVFCVRGNHVYNYKIQLAYTTNNQFSFELYAASTATAAEGVPSNPESVVVYDTHDGSGNKFYYYAPNGAVKLTGDFLNKDGAAAEILAKGDDVYHDLTYTPAGGSVYSNRQKYAVPLYWQTRSSVSPSLDANLDFCDYYILRVIWDSAASNNKETDILYLAAKNIT